MWENLQVETATLKAILIMGLILNIFVFRNGVLGSRRNEMEEHYKSTNILIRAQPAARKLKWKPT